MNEDEPEEEPGDALEVAPPAEMQADDVTMLLLSVPERVSDLLLGWDPEQLQYRHGPAFPTVEEVTRHLAATGVELDSEITELVLEAPPAAAAAADEPALVDLLQDWQRHRRRAADLLRGLPAERWEALKDRCERGLQHELGHLSQLRNLTALIPIA